MKKVSISLVVMLIAIVCVTTPTSRAEERAKKEVVEATIEAIRTEAENERIRQVKQHKYSPYMEGLLIAKQIRIGMTSEQVKFARGDPDKTYHITTMGGLYKQWVYGCKCLYFQFDTLVGDDRLMMIQE